jgi:hypothetical protein
MSWYFMWGTANRKSEEGIQYQCNTEVVEQLRNPYTELKLKGAEEGDNSHLYLFYLWNQQLTPLNTVLRSQSHFSSQEVSTS